MFFIAELHPSCQFTARPVFAVPNAILRQVARKGIGIQLVLFVDTSRIHFDPELKHLVNTNTRSINTPVFQAMGITGPEGLGAMG